MTKSTGEKSAFTYDFESYEVAVRITSNDVSLLSEIKFVVHRSLLGNLVPIEGRPPNLTFDLSYDAAGDIMLSRDGVDLGASDTKLKAFRFFDSILRVSVGEHAPHLVFIHAGVVEWKGRAIILPADSFQGKSTFVTELVRRGAKYYSDDFAILDADANVLPFPRPISMRSEDFKTFELSVDEIGGTIGTGPIPVRAIMFTRYEPDAVWEPILESAGSGVLKLIPFTLSIRNRTDFRMSVLHKLTSRAIIISTLRGSAESFAETLLDFVDKQGN